MLCCLYERYDVVEHYLRIFIFHVGTFFTVVVSYQGIASIVVFVYYL